jgi:ferredoxin
MADYLTRPPLPEPPVPVRRPTTPIPSAARSRKAPKAPTEPPRPPVDRAGRLRLRVNPISCDGHGLCAELLPEIVSLDEWGYPMPVVAEVPAELEGHAQRAAQQCPTLAIILERRQPRTT